MPRRVVSGLEDDAARQAVDHINRVIEESGGFDVPHGAHFDALLALVVEELGVQLAVEEVAVSEEVVDRISTMIALEIDYAFRLTERTSKTE